MTYLLSAQRWAEFISTYGEPTEISKTDAEKLDVHHVWTLCSLSNDVLVNELSEGADVISYWSTPRPWQGDKSSLIYDMTIWVSCPTCEQMSEEDEDWLEEDCEECEGSGTLFIEMEECIDAKTDEEVFSRRQAS